MLTRKCDFCGNPAEVDVKTIYGYWAYLCPTCNRKYGVKAFQTRLDELTEGGTRKYPAPYNEGNRNEVTKK